MEPSDECIDQVEADMRMLEDLLQKNRFTFEQTRTFGRPGKEYEEGDTSEKRQNSLLSILNEDTKSTATRTSSSKSFLFDELGPAARHQQEEEGEGEFLAGGYASSPGEEAYDVYERSSKPIEVTDMLYNASTSSTGEDVEQVEKEEEENLELTLKYLAEGGSGEQAAMHAHRIPVSVAGAKAKAADTKEKRGSGESVVTNAQQATMKKRKKKKAKSRPDATLPKPVPRNRHSVVNVLERVTAEEREELTFRPKLAWGKTPRSSTSNRVMDESYSRPKSSRARTEERINKLARPKTDKWTQRELEKLREEMTEASKYPYAPQIGERSSQLAAKPKSKSRQRATTGKKSEEGDGRDEMETDGELYEPIEVRLMKSQEARESQLRQAKVEKEYADLMHCTFRPNIAKGNSSKHLKKDYKPIHERLHKILQDKSLRLASLRMNQELEDPDLTFAPKINSKSAKLAYMKSVREELNTIERLASGMVSTSDVGVGKDRKARSLVAGKNTNTNTNTNKSEKTSTSNTCAVGSSKGVATWSPSMGFKEVDALGGGGSSSHSPSPGKSGGNGGEGALVLNLSKAVPREYVDCTFTPQISKKSKEILEKSKVWNPDFYKRQEQFVQQRERHLRESKRTDDPDCTFCPDIGNARDFLEDQANTHLEESKMERLTRLSSRDAEEKRIREKSLRESYYSQFNFKPHLSEKSRSMSVGPTDLHELVYNEKGEKIRRSIAREVEDDFNAKCTFKPNLRQSQKAIGSGGSKENVIPIANLQIAGDKDTVIQRIEHYRQEKELRIKEYRREMELEKMQECTFAPQTNQGGANKAKLNKPVIVHGLTKFLQNREMARMKEEEKKQREAQVFASGSRKPKACFTVAEPFRLSKSKTAHKKMEKLRQELEQDFTKQCTFKPKLCNFS